MAGRQYEERYVRGGLTFRENGRVISEARGPARPVPVLPPVHDATRAASMPQVQLAGMAPGGEIRGDVSGIGLPELITRYLQSQGVDVPRALRDAQYEHEHAGQRARERAARAQDYARHLRAAKRALDYETSGWLAEAPGFSLSKRNEAAERVNQLEGLLRECCVNDPELIAAVKARAAR